MIRRILALVSFCLCLSPFLAQAQTQFLTNVIANAPTANAPLSSGDLFVVVQDGVLKKVLGNSVISQDGTIVPGDCAYFSAAGLIRDSGVNCAAADIAVASAITSFFGGL